METAKEIGVREVIELDTLTGWSLPSHINLIIAVSYGLFIPARILNQAKYRGLNLHPSLLPDYRGSSPIQSAIINRDTDTGVTLQDLSAKAFDRGKILARVHLPIQNAETVTTAQLVEQVSQPAADLLIAGLEAGLYQHERTQALPPPELDHEPRDARKFAKDDMQLRHGMSALEAGARRRALGSLWFARSALSPKKKVVEQRVLLDDVCVVPAMAEGKRRKVDVIEKVGEGEDVCWSCEAFEHGDSVDLHLEGGKALRVRRATVSGQKQASGREVI